MSRRPCPPHASSSRRCRPELAGVGRAIRERPLLAGTIPDAALAGEQARVIASDRRFFATLAGRFPDGQDPRDT